jgi:hypothetical protein
MAQIYNPSAILPGKGCLQMKNTVSNTAALILFVAAIGLNSKLIAAGNRFMVLGWCFLIPAASALVVWNTTLSRVGPRLIFHAIFVFISFLIQIAINPYQLLNGFAGWAAFILVGTLFFQFVLFILKLRTER